MRINDNSLKRIYRLMLKRDPTAAEMACWHEREEISLCKLCDTLCWSPDLLRRIYSLRNEDDPATIYARDSGTVANYTIQDSYYKSAHDRLVAGGYHLSQKLLKLRSRPIVIELTIFDEVARDKSYIIAELKRRFEYLDFEIDIKSEDEIANRGFGDRTSIFLTNNNFIYRRFNDIKNQLDRRPDIISICSLTDNHHQYHVSQDAIDVFNFVFPAHANGHTYLTFSKAIVGPVIPTAVIQWDWKEIESFFAESKSNVRSNALYGRHTSYHGRVTARDRFLRAASRDALNNEIMVIPFDRQDWLDKTSAERFRDFANYRCSLCVPIFNDVPIRIFDALITGQIPIIPFGIPGLEISIPLELQKSLPVLVYFPNDLTSLRQAYEKAITTFDREGMDGVIRRHEYALKNHLGMHRVADIIETILSHSPEP